MTPSYILCVLFLESAGGSHSAWTEYLRILFRLGSDTIGDVHTVHKHTFTDNQKHTCIHTSSDTHKHTCTKFLGFFLESFFQLRGSFLLARFDVVTYKNRREEQNSHLELSVIHPLNSYFHTKPHCEIKPLGLVPFAATWRGKV